MRFDAPWKDILDRNVSDITISMRFLKQFRVLLLTWWLSDTYQHLHLKYIWYSIEWRLFLRDLLHLIDVWTTTKAFGIFSHEISRLLSQFKQHFFGYCFLKHLTHVLKTSETKQNDFSSIICTMTWYKLCYDRKIVVICWLIS